MGTCASAMETRISESLIKAVSGEFELGSVYKLQLARMNIRKIENLENCEHLQELNLSGNEIEAIEGLERLSNLRKLTITTCKIKSLEGLSKCRNLEHILIQENEISNIGEIAHLTGLQNLKSLYFKNIDGSQRNPLCEHPSYRSSIVRQLPQLTILDGERLKHANTVYSDAPSAPSSTQTVSIPESKPWLGDFSWEDEGGLDIDQTLGRVQAKFDAVYQESKKLNSAAMSLLSHYQ